MNQPRVSVLMCLLAPDPDYLRTATRSILEQTYTDFELRVYEQPSERPGQATLEEFDSDRIHYHRYDARVSLAASRQRSVAEARGEFVAIMDGDDESLPTRLAEQVSYLDANPSVSGVGSCLEVIGPAGERLGYRRYPLESGPLARRMRRSNALAQPSMLVRRQAIEASGGYRERPGGVCEDYELWARMMQQGHRFANLPRPLLRYRMHPKSTKSRKLRDSLRDTIAIKRSYWRREFDLGDRARILAERALLCLPTPWVTRMFLRSTLQQELTGSGR